MRLPPPKAPLRDRIGRRFARFATQTVVARPALWGLFRGPIRGQFDRLAGDWDGRVGAEGLAPLRAALEQVPVPTTSLDLGTGSGKGARMIAERFSDEAVVGADLSPAMIEQARASAPRRARRSGPFRGGKTHRPCPTRTGPSISWCSST